jgi:hypothetical protein
MRAFLILMIAEPPFILTYRMIRGSIRSENRFMACGGRVEDAPAM